MNGKHIRYLPIFIALVTLLFACPPPVPPVTNHVVSFDKNDALASGSMAPQTIIQGASADLTPCAFTKAGWTFAGWSTTPAGPVAYGDGALFAIGSADVTLYAQWVANGYSITFDKNDDAAAGAMPPQVISSGASASLTACAFTKPGWTFAGWATTSSGAVEYADGAPYAMGGADVTLYAKWTANLYSIVFDKNDAAASGVMPDQIIASGSSAPLTPCAFSKAGWTFAGWAASPAGTVAYGDGAAYTMGAAGGVTLYARWVANGYSVVFNKNDAAASGVMPDQVIASGSSAALSLCAFTKAGWSFAGWAVSPSGSIAYADGATYTMGSANVTLYAKWTANDYSISFDKNDSSAIGTMSPQTVACGSSATLTACAFYKPGWSFSGWATAPAGPVVYADGATYTMGAANVTLYAKWTGNNYTITFDKNDAAAIGSMADQVIAAGSSAALTPCGFGKTGSAFAGWATTPTGPVAYADGAVYTMGTANVTLYAKWAANSYTITFDKNDASATGTMSPQVIASGSSASLTPCGYGKAGWSFAGWATSAGGPAVFADRASYTMGAANVTLYAKWTANDYSITFDKNDVAAVGTMAQQTIACGSSGALTANAFYKPGWTFAGWATSAGGSVVYADGASYTMGTSNVTLYAKWTANVYAVTFDKNDAAASGSMADQSIASGSSANLSLNAFAKTGWSFAGWATTPGGSAAYADGASYTMGAINVTLYAKWTANNYTISFNKNDASATGTMANQIIAEGSTAGLTLCAFTKAGWTFAGWATTPGGSVVYANGTSYTMGTANVTLYAKWTANNYTITFDKNDASATGTMANQTLASGSTAALNPCAYSKTGSTFAGWATSAGGSVVYADGASYTIGSANVTLYARWTAITYTVIFDKNDPDAVGSMSPQSIASGSSAYLSSCAFTKAGWSFSGWAVTPTGSVAYANGALYTMGSANVTLYAKWTANNYAITFNKNDSGATGTMANQTIASGSSANLTLCAFSKYGYTFSGWAVTAGGVAAYTNGASYTMGSSNVTLYATWTPTVYYVNFDKNEAAATGTMDPQGIPYGTSANLTLCGFSKPGWSFTGWATTPGGAAIYNDGYNYSIGGANVTLYAKWAVINHTVTFDKNDSSATGSMGTQTIAEGTAANLTLCAFTKTGWSFAGWATSPSGSIAYADGATYTMGTANVTLYAKWTANNYSITFNKNDAAAAGSMATQTIASGSTASLALCAFTKPGWSFLGWATFSVGSVAYSDGANYTMGSANVTLYAKWTANNYTITFDKNDAAATGSMSQQTIACSSSASLTLNAFAKSGWTFSGWATSPSGPVAYANGVSYTMGSVSVTLYAKWTANNYTITFNKNDAAASGSMAAQTIASGSTVNLSLNSFTKAGWSFSGWATTAGGTVEYADGTGYTMGTSNVTLYAKWTANFYTITFDKNDAAATGSMAPQTIASGSTANLTLCGFVKTGYSFYQWTTSPSGGYVYTDGAAYTMGSADLTLYAHWTTTYYTVTFDSQGGSAVSPGTTTYGHTVTQPSSPVWSGYMFAGWFKESACLNRWNFSVDTVTANMTLYAKWLVCTPGLSYVLINGDTEYGVAKGSANTAGNVIVPEYCGTKLVTAVMGSGFNGCSTMTGITLPPSIREIQYSAFQNCTSLTSCTCLGSMTSVGTDAFNGCTSLTTVSMPNGTASFGQNIFYNCTALTTVTLPSSVTSLGPYSFYNCTSLVSVLLPDGITYLYNIFQHCPTLTSVTLPETLTTIDTNAFYDCTSLTTLTIPANVTTINQAGIMNCANLATVTVNAVTPPTNDINNFNYCPALTAIRVPAGSVDAYKAAAGWITYASLIVSQ